MVDEDPVLRHYVVAKRQHQGGLSRINLALAFAAINDNPLPHYFPNPEGFHASPLGLIVFYGVVAIIFKGSISASYRTPFRGPSSFSSHHLNENRIVPLYTTIVGCLGTLVNCYLVGIRKRKRTKRPRKVKKESER